jgi:hypothetical protein
MQTKNLSLHPVILVAKALPQHLVLPLQSKPVISVFNRVSPATAATHAQNAFKENADALS